MCSNCSGGWDQEYEWDAITKAVQRHLDSGRPEREFAADEARSQSGPIATRKLRILMDHSIPDSEALRLTAQIDREVA
jgi:hypothetical protein